MKMRSGRRLFRPGSRRQGPPVPLRRDRCRYCARPPGLRRITAPPPGWLSIQTECGGIMAVKSGTGRALPSIRKRPCGLSRSREPDPWNPVSIESMPLAGACAGRSAGDTPTAGTTARERMTEPGPIMGRMEAFSRENGGGVSARRGGGCTVAFTATQAPIARLGPEGLGDRMRIFRLVLAGKVEGCRPYGRHRDCRSIA